jgi:hypothetical protein
VCHGHICLLQTTRILHIVLVQVEAEIGREKQPTLTPQHHILLQTGTACASAFCPSDLEHTTTLVLLEENPNKSLLHLPIFQLILHHRHCSHHNKNLLALMRLGNHCLLIRSTFHRNNV